jgi:hypothetical protein
MYLAGAWVDGSLGVHCKMADHAGNQWAGNARVLVFAWKNNMGTVVTSSSGNESFVSIPLADGTTFGLICAKEMANGSTLAAPTGLSAMPATLEPMLGPSDSFTTSSGGHAQGVGACYLDGNDQVHCTFNDGSGDVWNGSADVFATYTIAGVAVPIVVVVTPATASVTQGSITPFSAVVTGTSDQSVNWSVDGIAGGDAAVGTIDANGNYTSPTTPGTHRISAASAIDALATGAATVVVTGASSVTVAPGGGGTVVVTSGGSTTTVTPGVGAAIALAAPNGGTTYIVGDTTPVTLENPEQSFYFVNGVKRIYGVFYTISGTTLTILNAGEAPRSGDTHELYGS